MTIKEDKVMYAQHNQGHGGRVYCHSKDRDSGNNEERTNKLAKLEWTRMR